MPPMSDLFVAISTLAVPRALFYERKAFLDILCLRSSGEGRSDEPVQLSKIWRWLNFAICFPRVQIYVVSAKRAGTCVFNVFTQ